MSLKLNGRLARIAGAAAIGLIALSAAPLTTVAQTAQGVAELTPGDQDTIQRVEDYLNSIKTLDARFQQVDSNNKRASGRIYIQKPGKLRFEYDPPTPVLIVANGRHL